MTEAPAEQPIRLGPAAANVARSIWHQKELLVLGLVLGLALGWLALPKVLSGGSTYDATIRMQVVQAPTDASWRTRRCSARPPGRTPRAAPRPRCSRTSSSPTASSSSSTRARSSMSRDELTPILLLNRLSITPLEGTSYVDLAFSDGDPGAGRRRGGAVRQAVRRRAQPVRGAPPGAS